MSHLRVDKANPTFDNVAVLQLVPAAHSSKDKLPSLRLAPELSWKASQLMFIVPFDPRPVSRRQTVNPDVVTEVTHNTAGSYMLTAGFPWLREANTFTSPEPGNDEGKKASLQKKSLSRVVLTCTFPALNVIPKNCI